MANAVLSAFGKCPDNLLLVCARFLNHPRFPKGKAPVRPPSNIRLAWMRTLGDIQCAQFFFESSIPFQETLIEETPTFEKNFKCHLDLRINAPPLEHEEEMQQIEYSVSLECDDSPKIFEVIANVMAKYQINIVQYDLVRSEIRTGIDLLRHCVRGFGNSGVGQWCFGHDVANGLQQLYENHNIKTHWCDFSRDDIGSTLRQGFFRYLDRKAAKSPKGYVYMTVIGPDQVTRLSAIRRHVQSALDKAGIINPPVVRVASRSMGAVAINVTCMKADQPTLDILEGLREVLKLRFKLTHFGLELDEKSPWHYRALSRKAVVQIEKNVDRPNLLADLCTSITELPEFEDSPIRIAEFDGYAAPAWISPLPLQPIHGEIDRIRNGTRVDFGILIGEELDTSKVEEALKTVCSVHGCAVKIIWLD